jgi:acetyl esterase/lipase
VDWALFAVGVFLLLATLPSLAPVHHWAFLFPAFVLSLLGAALAGWWLVVVPVTVGVLVALGALDAWPGWVGLVLCLVAVVGLVRQNLLARRAGAVFDAALRPLDPTPYVRTPRTVRSVLLPFWMGDHAVERTKNIRYAPGDGRRHLLDVYRARVRVDDGAPPAPVLLQLHGGAWVVGNKDSQGRPLMNALAEAGWVCVAPNYRLSPRAKYPTHLVDCKQALAWVREHIGEFGGDPDRVFVTGGSAGGHLAAMVALTANDPAFQPGFESIDTSVCGCIPMYGAYDLEELFGRFPSRLGGAVATWMGALVLGVRIMDDPEPFRAASPLRHVTAAAPPFFIVHGSLDNLVPVDEARRLAAGLRAADVGVVYVELPGAPHAFDVFHSTWADAAVAGVARYLTWALTNPGAERSEDVGTPASDPTTMARTAPS